MKNNEKVTKVVTCVAMGLIGAAALACIIISMVTDKTTPYLAMGLGLGAIGNALGMMLNLRKKGKNN